MTLRAVAAGSGSGGITIGTTTITGGATTEVLYNLAGVVQSTSKLIINAAAGAGPSIIAGTAITDVNALSITQTWNNAAVTTGVKISITDTTSASTSNLIDILGGAAGATRYFAVSKAGVLWATGGLYVGNGPLTSAVSAAFVGNNTYFYSSGAAAVLNIRGTTAVIAGVTGTIFGMTASANDATGAMDTGLSRVSAGVIGVGTGAAASVAGTLSAIAYISGGSAGVDFGPSVVTSITVKKGIVTAIS